MKINFTKVLLLFFVIGFIPFLETQAQIITTVAGNGTAAYGGDGGQATNAELNNPGTVIVDSSGNIYIADLMNNVVRKVTYSTGVITTIAGYVSSGGYSGDNGSATNAQLDWPSGLALDDSNNVYIGDFLNDRVRKVTIATGIITTIAGGGSSGIGDGGPATAAELSSPTGVITDDMGNIYIADQGDQRIRKVSKATGIITTIVGNGNGGFSGDGGQATDAELENPYDLKRDTAGNIYFTDLYNERVRKVVAATGIISTIAGDGSAGFYGDGGSAISGEFDFPEDLALDDSDNIYIADIFNNRIRKINTSTGIISTIIGNGTAGYAGDCGPAAACELNEPSGVFVDKYQNIYVADWANNRVRKTSNSSGIALTVTPQLPSLCNGQSVLLTVSGGTTYTWSPKTGLSATTGDTITAAPTVTVTYTVTSTSGTCSAIGSDIVTVIPTPNKPIITVSVTGDSLISSATQGNQWYFNDTLISGGTNQTYTLTASGWYEVTVINPANGCSSNSDSIYIKLSGINQLSVISEQLSIYPNPTTGNVFLTISSSAQNVKDWNLKVTDMLGRTVLTTSTLNYCNDIDLSELSNGVYFITVSNKTADRAVFPVVKQ